MKFVRILYHENQKKAIVNKNEKINKKVLTDQKESDIIDAPLRVGFFVLPEMRHAERLGQTPLGEGGTQVFPKKNQIF
jgi:hypothetical protein